MKRGVFVSKFAFGTASKPASEKKPPHRKLSAIWHPSTEVLFFLAGHQPKCINQIFKQGFWVDCQVCVLWKWHNALLPF